MGNKIELQLRTPAEWQTDGYIMIAWPNASTDWGYMLEEVEECYIRLAEAIVDDSPLLIVTPDIERPKRLLAHLNQERIIYSQVAINDTWTRDYGPITVETPNGAVGCDFKFNGWGLKFAACYDNLVTSRLYENHTIYGLYMNCLGFVLEGGSIESDGEGTLLTTSECLLSPNRNGSCSREEIEETLSHTLGFTRFLWLNHGYLAGDDTDSHIDTLARFAPNDTIVYVKCDNEKDEHYTELKEMEEELKTFRTNNGNPYNLIALPFPEAIFDEEGVRLPATYANFLVTPRTVFLPVYDQPGHDAKAEEAIMKAFPEHKIVTVNCRALIKQHGSLHCATMQLPKEIVAI